MSCLETHFVQVHLLLCLVETTHQLNAQGLKNQTACVLNNKVSIRFCLVVSCALKLKTAILKPTVLYHTTKLNVISFKEGVVMVWEFH